MAGAGTGGTITGLSRAIRDNEAGQGGGTRTTVLAVDPEGSILGGGEPGNYAVEGIGYASCITLLDGTSAYVFVGFLPRGVGSQTACRR